MPQPTSPKNDHDAAWDVMVELTRTLTATMEKWHACEDQPGWVELREAFIAVRMTAEIGEEVCDGVLDVGRHLSVAPTDD